MAASGVLVPPVVEQRSASEFRVLFREHFRFVCLSLRRLGVGEGEVEDVAQDVFVTVHRKLDTYDQTRSIRVWLFAFCLRAAAGHRRLARLHRQVPAETTPEVAADGRLPDDELAAEQDRRLVFAALDGIDPQRRVVFVMYDLEGFSVTEIADTLAIPVNTVYSRLRVAREEFRQQVLRLRARRPR